MHFPDSFDKKISRCGVFSTVFTVILDISLIINSKFGNYDITLQEILSHILSLIK